MNGELRPIFFFFCCVVLENSMFVLAPSDLSNLVVLDGEMLELLRNELSCVFKVYDDMFCIVPAMFWPLSDCFLGLLLRR